MTWSESRPTEHPGLAGRLQPDRVLYNYEGPILFTTKLGFITLLVYKVDEDDEKCSELFLIKQIEEAEIDRLIASRISLRGALTSDNYWLVETSNSRLASRTWKVSGSDLPDRYLPKAGLGLHSSKGRLPDTETQADAFFSVRFQGEGFRRGQVSFRLFKSLTDIFYNASVRLLRPDALAGMKTAAVFDIPLLEPKFSSLAVGVQRPVIDTALVNEKNASRGIPASTDLDEQSTQRRDAFFASFGEVASAASDGKLTSSGAGQHFMLLETVSGLLPTQDNLVQSTEFFGDGSISGEHIFLDQTVGSRLRQYYEQAKNEPVKLFGRVETVNGPSHTFIIANAVSGRQCTCAMPWEWFNFADTNGELQRGMIAHVFGDFSRRTNRDYIWLRNPPQFFKDLGASQAALF